MRKKILQLMNIYIVEIYQLQNVDCVTVCGCVGVWVCGCVGVLVGVWVCVWV